MNFNFASKHPGKRFMGALLGAGALLAIAGCSGSSDNNNNGNTNSNSGLTSASLVALTDNNQLLSFNSRTPGTSTTASVSGLTTGDSLEAIDFRLAPPNLPTITGNNGQTGLYAIGQNGSTQQLYRLTIAGTVATATRVGARFSLIPASPNATAFGLDFNPQVDRLRLVESAGNRNLRLNPNAAEGVSPIVDGSPDTPAGPGTPGVQADGPLTYATGDGNVGRNPDAVGAAYLNPDSDGATGTTLYILDAAQNTLATQGRADDPATVGVDETVNPNSGTLFTVGNVNLDVTQNTGFDISPTGNAGFVSNGNRIFGIAIAPGAGRGTVTGGAAVSAPSGSTIIGLAATS